MRSKNCHYPLARSRDWRDLNCSKAILAILSIKLFTFLMFATQSLDNTMNWGKQYNCPYLPIAETVASSETGVSSMKDFFTKGLIIILSKFHIEQKIVTWPSFMRPGVMTVFKCLNPFEIRNPHCVWKNLIFHEILKKNNRSNSCLTKSLWKEYLRQNSDFFLSYQQTRCSRCCFINSFVIH